MTLRIALDDTTYGELLDDVMARLPAVAPTWTDHNPSDPGIVLLELFAWLAEMLIYQADQLTDAHYDAFLRLLNGPSWQRSGAVEDAVADAVAAVRHRWRAATAFDLAALALEDWPASSEALALGDDAAVRRAHVVVGRDLSDADPSTPRSGHVSLVVLPERAPAGGVAPSSSGRAQLQPSPALLSGLAAWLEPRRLLGVRHHIVGPTYVPVTVTGDVTLRDGYVPAAVARAGAVTDQAVLSASAEVIAGAVSALFDPLAGGPDGHGWPFGRPVYLSEVYQALDGLNAVDFVEDLRFVGLPAERSLRAPDGTVSGARLGPHELADVRIAGPEAGADRLVVHLADPNQGAR